MANLGIFFNGAFNKNADPWNKYLVNSPPPINPFEWGQWYAKGQDKVAEYKGYQSLGVEPNWRYWSDNGQGYTNYSRYIMNPGSTGAFTAFGKAKKRKRYRGYRIPRK